MGIFEQLRGEPTVPKPEAEPEVVEVEANITGSFACSTCSKRASEGFYDHESSTLTYVCSNEHVTTLEGFSLIV